jgi:hypothetical protein
VDLETLCMKQMEKEKETGLHGEFDLVRKWNEVE